MSVDYSSHITHYFMSCNAETRHKRVETTIAEIGPAVFSGAFSTYLAFLLLVTSETYVIETFFKIFSLMVIFGGFHALFFLPVILCLIGPDPYENNNETVNAAAGGDGDVESVDLPARRSLNLSRSKIDIDVGKVQPVALPTKNVASIS